MQINLGHTSVVKKADPGPPSWGRWKVYVDGKYRGSAATKKAGEKLAQELIDEMDSKL